MTLSGALSILLVEDSDINREIAQAFLSRAGHRVTPCASGEEALKTLADGENPIDLVLMDIRLPGMDGVETTRHIRNLTSPAAGTPVFALTANDQPAEAQRCLEAGLNGVLGKPLRRDSFEQAVAALAGGAALSPTAPTEAVSSALLDEERIGVLREAFTPDKLAELFDAARRSILEEASALDRAWQDGHSAAIAQHAHRLAGVAGNFACVALYQSAAAVEKDCTNGRDGRGLAASLKNILSATLSAFPTAS